MTFDSIVLAAVADELNSKLTDGRVDKIHQPAPLDVVFTVRNRGAGYALLISAETQSPRINLTSVKQPNPKTPPNFCMVLRKYLEGALFLGVEQADFDRVLRLNFAAYDGERLALVVEIMGKHSNVILTGDTGRILGAIKPVGRSKNRYREVLPGRQYVSPPPQGKVNPLALTIEEFNSLLDDTFSGGSNEEIAARLVKTFTGISPFAARELALRSAGDPGRLKAEFRDMFDKVRGGEFAPVLITDDSGASIGFYAFPSVQHSASNQHERPSISEVADMYYTSALPKDALQQAKASLVGRLGRELESRKHALEEIQDGLRESGNAERLKQIGELILSQTASIPPETDSVGLVDYYDPNGATIRVELDPQLSAPENAEAYFRKYHKAVSGAEALRDRLAETETEIKLIRKALESADSITSEDEVDELARASAAQGIHIGRQDRVETEQRKAEFEGHKIARVNSSGWEILVGENSEANDYLLTRIARPSDWWLHVKASPSAHVVIRSNGKPETVPKSVLHAAAELAARHSDQKHSSLVPVDYTLRKYVRKPKGSPPGKAIYRGEKTIFLTPNP